MSKSKKPYWEMDPAELAKATAEFDREMIATPGRALTGTQRARHQRARRPGRPPVGQGSERVNVTIERGLLNAADKLARSKGWTRAELIAMGLRHAIAGAAKAGRALPNKHKRTVASESRNASA